MGEEMMSMARAFRARRWIKAAILAAALLPLNGCMFGMYGIGHDGMTAPGDMGRAVVNTVETQRLRVALDLSPMTAGAEARVTVRVTHAQTGEPVSVTATQSVAKSAAGGADRMTPAAAAAGVGIVLMMLVLMVAL